MTVVCDQRGRHALGPARLESGDPFGYRQHVRRLTEADELLVLPKTFAVAPARLVSRLALGPARAGALVMADPSRIVGLARLPVGGPAAPRRLAGDGTPGHPDGPDLRADGHSPGGGGARHAPAGPLRPAELFEFAVAVAASMVLELASRKVGVGLVSTGSVAGRPVALPPSTSPDAPGRILESLACLSPFGLRTPEAVTDAVARSAGPGTSLLVIGGAFPPDLLAGLADVRRRGVPVAALHVGRPPPGAAPSRLFDDFYVTDLHDDWRERTTIELVG